jgi:hypothetical protein
MSKVMRTAAVAWVVALFCVPLAGAGAISIGVHTSGVAQAVHNPACVIAFTITGLGNDPRPGFSEVWTVSECVQAVTPNADGTQSYSGVVAFTDSSGNSVFASLSGILMVTRTGDLWFKSGTGRVTAGTGVYAGKFGAVRGRGFVSFTHPEQLFTGLTFIFGLRVN